MSGNTLMRWIGRVWPDPGADPPSHDLRVDADVICPRCLRYVGPVDIVRRTAYGLVQHEHCPEVAARLG